MASSSSMIFCHRYCWSLSLASIVLLMLGTSVALSEPPPVRVIDVRSTPSFSPVSPGSVPSSWLGGDRKPHFVAGDLNGDGRSEVLLQNVAGSELLVLENIERDRFSKHSIRIEGSSLRLLGAKDLNADGCDDVLFDSATENSLLIAFADCRFGFNGRTAVSLSGAFDAGDRPHDVQTFPTAGAAAELVLSNLPIGARIFRVKEGKVLPYAELSLSGDALQIAIPTRILLADIDGDQRPELLSPRSDGSNDLWFRTSENAPSRPFFQLPLSARDTRFLAINLNHDGRTDFLAWSNEKPSIGWFAVLSLPEAGIGISIRAPLPNEADYDNAVVGDFNGDGFFDVFSVSRDHSQGETKIWLALRTPPQEIPGVASSADSKNMRKPAFEKAGYAFFQDSPRVVTGEKLSAKEGSIGHNFGFLGDPTGPYVCIGFTPQGAQDAWHRTRTSCPENYAIFGVTRVRRGRAGKISEPVEGVCCRLPANDILGKEVSVTGDLCPSDSLITGFQQKDDAIQLRCTQLNTARYRLNSKYHGRFWGFSLSMRGEKNRIPMFQIPVAFRIGASRSSWQATQSSGCIGETFGGLFVDLRGSTCEEHAVARLEYQGQPGDPEKGEPVQMFPACARIDDPYNPLTGCLSTAQAVGSSK